MALQVMVVEDERALSRVIERQLKRRGIRTLLASTIAEAHALLEQHRVHAILVDIRLPDGHGLAVLEKLPAGRRPAVIVMTGDATVDVAVGALRLGAVDFLLKPFSTEALDAALARVITGPKPGVVVPLEPSAADGWRRRHAPQMLGNHPSLLRVFDILSRVADTDCSILVQGETGTGKELIARGIHSGSGRGAKPFIAVNCAAIPEHLMESELFGHARGAFTGAHAAREGRFQAAHGGTLFLDEIGEMPLLLQAKLLRALQENEITPVGESRAVEVDVRIVAATHRKLEEMVAARTFREDLLYRLDVVRITLPALRERRSDIPLLVRELIRSVNEKRHRTVLDVEPEALELLSAQAWPGNVRQLQNVIERTVLLRGEGVITTDDLPDELRGALPSRNGPDVPIPLLPAEGLDLKEAVERYENALIDQALERAGGNKTRAAALLHMNRTTLVEKLRKRGILDEAV